MNSRIIAIFAEQGGRLISELIRNRPHRVESQPTTEISTEPEETFEAAAKEAEKGEVATACIPCAIGHYGTCSGLLNEAMRFAKKDGIGSSEVIDRVNMCLDELNAMERVDLRPELTQDLPDWEKELADRALVESRKTRHSLEGLRDVNDLEKTAASLQTARNEIGRTWFKQRLPAMSKEAKAEVAEKAAEKLEV